MTKPLLFIAALFAFASSQAQTFVDDFESYTTGDMLAASSNTWETWTNANGGADEHIDDASHQQHNHADK